MKCTHYPFFPIHDDVVVRKDEIWDYYCNYVHVCVWSGIVMPTSWRWRGQSLSPCPVHWCTPIGIQKQSFSHPEDLTYGISAPRTVSYLIFSWSFYLILFSQYVCTFIKNSIKKFPSQRLSHAPCIQLWLYYFIVG